MPCFHLNFQIFVVMASADISLLDLAVCKRQNGKWKVLSYLK